MIIKNFVDPCTKESLQFASNGDLFYEKGSTRVVYQNQNGVYDFTQQNDERQHYQNFYDTQAPSALSLAEIFNPWQDNTNCRNALLLESLGNLQGKTVLVLGNGISVKELYFVCLGAQLVYTDLAVNAVSFMRDRVIQSKLPALPKENIDFHAVDAYHLPYPDETFDVIYGCEFVHHLSDLDTFFSEIGRCLKPFGICRFNDDAYTPWWQFAKATVLKPLQRRSHRKWGLSPADLLATERGGYKYEDLLRWKEIKDFRHLIFIRHTLFTMLYRHGIGRTIGYDNFLYRHHEPVSRILVQIDRFLAAHSNLIRRNMFYLVWGFDK